MKPQRIPHPAFARALAGASRRVLRHRHPLATVCDLPQHERGALLGGVGMIAFGSVASARLRAALEQNGNNW